MDKIDQALDILKKDEVKNQSIINFIESNPVFNVEIENDALLVRGLSDQAWVYIHGDDNEDTKKTAKENFYRG